MKITLYSVLLICPLFCLGQTRHSTEGMKQDSAFIEGQFILSDEKPASVTFYVVDYWLGIERNEHTTVDNEGRFQIKFFIRNTHQVNWAIAERRNHGTLILSPGDSLTLMITDSGAKFSGKNV